MQPADLSRFFNERPVPRLVEDAETFTQRSLRDDSFNEILHVADCCFSLCNKAESKFSVTLDVKEVFLRQTGP